MAYSSANSLLKKELECSICLEELKDPVVAGECNHSFCKACLRRYVQVQRQRGEFQCPQCRRRCRLPDNGVDGLTFDFKLANIVEIVKKKGSKLNNLKNKCELCNETEQNATAELACSQCDCINLCDYCGIEHLQDPDTATHELVSLCQLHGKPLNKFCLNCGRPICVVCFRGKHSNRSSHTVKEYRDVLKGDKAALNASIDQTKAATVAVDGAVKQLGEIDNQVVEMKKRSVATVSGKIGADVSGFDDDIVNLKTEIHYLQNEFERKREELKIKEDMKSSMEEEKKRLITKIETDCQGLSNDVASTKQEVTSIRRDIKETVSLGQTQVSNKLLQDDLHSDIVKSRTKLEELTTAAKVDRVTPLKEKLKGVRGVGVYEEYAQGAGKFTSACLSFKLETPAGFSTHSVSYMSRDRIAATGQVGGPHQVLLYKLPSLTPNVILTDKAHIPYIAALGEDKLVVLRRQNPILKVIDVVTNETRDIRVEIPKEAIDKLWSVEVCHDNFLITYDRAKDANDMTIAQVATDGTVKQAIKCGKPYRPTFCRLTGLLTLCTNISSTISCYNATSDITELLSVPHGVKGFTCIDICSGSLGEIFIVGVGEKKEDETYDVRVFQVFLDTGKKTVSMKEIVVIGEKMISKDSAPKCSINGNCLVIGAKDKVWVFKLSG